MSDSKKVRTYIGILYAILAIILVASILLGAIVWP